MLNLMIGFSLTMEKVKQDLLIKVNRKMYNAMMYPQLFFSRVLS